MNTKASLHAVPSASDSLRAAHAERDRLASISADLTAQIEKLAPFQAEVAMAQAELQAATQRDADAMYDWVKNGAGGKAPELNVRGREEAARKLAAAQAKLNAATGVRGDLEQHLTENNERIHHHREHVLSAEVDVVAEEAMRLLSEARQQSIAVLESEAAFIHVHQHLRNYLNASWGVTTNQGPAVSAWLERINASNQLTKDERSEAMHRGRSRAEAKLQHLLSGEDPVK